MSNAEYIRNLIREAAEKLVIQGHIMRTQREIFENFLSFTFEEYILIEDPDLLLEIKNPGNKNIIIKVIVNFCRHERNNIIRSTPPLYKKSLGMRYAHPVNPLLMRLARDLLKRIRREIERVRVR